MNLTVFAPYYPPHTGGLETHAAEFNKYLTHYGSNVNITVFTPRLPATALEQETQGNIKVIRFPATEIIPNFPFPKIWTLHYWRLYKQLTTTPSDVVISRTRFFFTSIMAWFYARTRHKKYVHIEHGSDFVQLDSAITSLCARIYDYTFGKFVLCFSDKNISISEAVRDFVKTFDKRDSPVVYRGVETEFIQSVQPNKEFKSQYKDKIVITFVGRLIDGKGVKDLLLALKKLDNDNVIGCIIGDGPQRAVLEKLADELKLQSKVCFLGKLPLDEALSIVKVSDIFVNPSYTEGLPSSVIEAALCRVAIIATDVGGTREIISDGQSGILISPRDPELLVRKLQFLIENKATRSQYAETAYKHAETLFTWEKSAKAYIKIFNSLLDRK